MLSIHSGSLLKRVNSPIFCVCRLASAVWYCLIPTTKAKQRKPAVVGACQDVQWARCVAVGLGLGSISLLRLRWRCLAARCAFHSFTLSLCMQRWLPPVGLATAPFCSAKCRCYRLARQFSLCPKGRREKRWLVKVQLFDCVPVWMAFLRLFLQLGNWSPGSAHAATALPAPAAGFGLRDVCPWGEPRAATSCLDVGLCQSWEAPCMLGGADQRDEFNNQRVIKLQPIFFSFPHACPFLYRDSIFIVLGNGEHQSLASLGAGSWRTDY